MSFLERFDSYPLSPNVTVGTTAVLSAWPLSPTGAQRIISVGRGGTNALDLRGNAGIPTTILRRGVSGPATGRSKYVRFGFAISIHGRPGSFLQLNPATLPEQVASGTLLLQLEVSAERGINPIANPLQATECYDVALDEFSAAVGPADGAQAVFVEGTRYFAPAFSLYINSDGFLRVIKGRYGASAAFGSLSFGNEQVVGTTAFPLPLRQWVTVECEVSQGTADGSDGYCRIWVDGELALEALAINFVVRGLMESSRSAAYSGGSLLPYPTTRNDCTPYRADTQGFHAVAIADAFAATDEVVALDDFWLFAAPPAAVGVPFGDFLVRELPPVSDGSPQDSTISGSAPAATRWESVLTDDGDTSTVALAAAGDEDVYGMADTNGTDTIKAVRVVARARKSDGGAADVSLSVRNADGTLRSEVAPVASASDYETIEASWPMDPLDATWSPSSVDASSAGVRRER